MEKKKVVKSDEEWKESLTPLEYLVTRKKATEKPFTGKYWNNPRTGVYRCVCCGLEMFQSSAKFESSCGWPSFREPVDKQNLEEAVDRAHGLRRTEVLCSQCQAHLGHVFEDGPPPEGMRYCINSAALYFDPEAPDPQSRSSDTPTDEIPIQPLEDDDLRDWIEPEDHGLIES